jgi:hypothetical protein
MIEDAKYAQEHFMVMKRKENTDKYERMYDVTTDTWYVQTGDCTYCGIRLYSNEGLNDSNYHTVKTNDGKIIRVCKEQRTAPKNEVEHRSPEVHQMILKRIAERKQREKGQ